MDRITYYCPGCGLKDLSFSHISRWDDRLQCFVAVEDVTVADCANCGAEVTPTEADLDEERAHHA